MEYKMRSGVKSKDTFLKINSEELCNGQYGYQRIPNKCTHAGYEVTAIHLYQNTNWAVQIIGSANSELKTMKIEAVEYIAEKISLSSRDASSSCGLNFLRERSSMSMASEIGCTQPKQLHHQRKGAQTPLNTLKWMGSTRLT
jgi:hypothetical protein